MFRDRYRNLISSIAADGRLIESVCGYAEYYEQRKKVKPFRVYRPVLIFIISCLCVFAAMPVLAATVEPVYRLIYMVSPAAAQFFMPVQKSCEYDGIKMEVVSVYVHENTLEAYVTMQDMTGDRIDATTDLYDSYSINRPFDSSAVCRFAGYDETEKKASFLIVIDEWGGGRIDDEKITFSVREFLSHKLEYEDVRVDTELSEIKKADHVQRVDVTGGGGELWENGMDKNIYALVPAEPMDGFPTDGISLTGIGYVDGMLHVQTTVQDPLSNDNHCWLRLKDKEGNTVDCVYGFSFIHQNDRQIRTDSHEFVFDVPAEQIADYTLYGDFVISGMRTEGKWRVTFPAQNIQ